MKFKMGQARPCRGLQSMLKGLNLYHTKGKPLKDLFEQEKKYITYILGLLWHLSEESGGKGGSRIAAWDFPSDSVAKTLCSQFKGPG